MIQAVAALRAEGQTCAEARSDVEASTAQISQLVIQMSGMQSQLEAQLVRQQRRLQGLLCIGGKDQPAAAKVPGNVRKAFELFDADGSGDIDTAELSQALEQLGMETNTIQTRQVLKKYDKGGKGNTGGKGGKGEIG